MKKTTQKKLLLISYRLVIFILTVSYIIPQVMNQTSSSSPTGSTTSSSSSPLTGRTQTNCTVDKCATCVDPVQLTCATCQAGWYKKTYRGGNKSYDACWSIWKLVLALLLLCCCACCCAACMMFFKNRGVRGQPCCCDFKQTMRREMYGDSRPRQEYVQTRQPTYQQPTRVVRQAPQARPVSYSTAQPVRYAPQTSQPVRVIRAQPSDPTSIYQSPRNSQYQPATRYING